MLESQCWQREQKALHFRIQKKLLFLLRAFPEKNDIK
jgi:hypothetical protein